MTSLVDSSSGGDTTGRQQQLVPQTPSTAEPSRSHPVVPFSFLPAGQLLLCVWFVHVQVCIQGIPWKYTETELGDLVAECGEVEKAEVMTSPDGRSKVGRAGWLVG